MEKPAVIPRKENSRIKRKDSPDADSPDAGTDPPDRGINRQRGNCSDFNKKENDQKQQTVQQTRENKRKTVKNIRMVQQKKTLVLPENARGFP